MDYRTDYERVLEEQIDALKDLDNRWRPMRTAPRDGSVIEIRKTGGAVINAPFPEPMDPTGDAPWGNGWAWRPAHPEWNEEE